MAEIVRRGGARRVRLALAALLLVATTVALGANPSAAATHAVSVTPSTGLVDGQQVTVELTGLGGEDYAEPFLCTAGASVTESTLLSPNGPCGVPGNYGDQNRADVIPLWINATFARGLGRGGRVDCRTTACEIVAVTLDRSISVFARTPVAFDPAGTLRPTPVLSVDPALDLVDGQEITAKLTGTVGNGGTLAQCSHTPTSASDLFESCLPIDEARIGPGGTSASAFPVAAFLPLDSGLVDCREVTATCALALYRAAGDDIPATTLQFQPDGPVAPQLLDRGFDEGGTFTVDAIGFTPGATLTLAFCNEAGDCLSRPTTTAAVAANGTATGLVLDLNDLDEAEVSALCGDEEGCLLTGTDSTGVTATGGLGVGGGEEGGPTLDRRPMTVTPDHDLVDGQTVAVEATGFDPDADIETLMCDNGFAVLGYGSCDLGDQFLRRARRYAGLKELAKARGFRVTGRDLAADGTYTGTYDVQQRITLADTGEVFDCKDGNVDPAGFALLTAEQQAEVLAPGSGWRTCMVVVDDLGQDAVAGYAPIAFEGAVFKALPGQTPGAGGGGTGTAAPATPVRGNPSYAG